MRFALLAGAALCTAAGVAAMPVSSSFGVGCNLQTAAFCSGKEHLDSYYGISMPCCRPAPAFPSCSPGVDYGAIHLMKRGLSHLVGRDLWNTTPCVPKPEPDCGSGSHLMSYFGGSGCTPAPKLPAYCYDPRIPEYPLPPECSVGGGGGGSPVDHPAVPVHADFGGVGTPQKKTIPAPKNPNLYVVSIPIFHTFSVESHKFDQKCTDMGGTHDTDGHIVAELANTFEKYCFLHKGTDKEKDVTVPLAHSMGWKIEKPSATSLLKAKQAGTQHHGKESDNHGGEKQQGKIASDEGNNSNHGDDHNK